MPLVQSWEDFFTQYVHGMIFTWIISFVICNISREYYVKIIPQYNLKNYVNITSKTASDFFHKFLYAAFGQAS